MNLVATIFLFEITPDLFSEPGGELVWTGLQRDFDRSGFRLVGLIGGDLSILKHGIDYQVAALLGLIRIGDRGISAGRFRQSGEDGSFIECEIARTLIEIKLRSRFESINTVAKIDLIAIHGEDLLLGEATLDLQ